MLRYEGIAPITRAMRVLVLSDLFPPVAFGGYERECATVVAHLRESHEVCVLTSDASRDEIPAEPGVVRELPYLGRGRLREVLRAPGVALRAARTARRVLDEFRPDVIYAWEGLLVPQAALAVAAGHGVPLLYRFCLPWSARVFESDRFLRELDGSGRGLRGTWGKSMRLVNRLPGLGFDVTTAHPAAVSWASEALRSVVALPGALEPVCERVVWPATEQAEGFATVERAPLERPTVAFVGRAVEEKGIDIGLRAFALLRERHGIDAQLLMAGPQPEPEWSGHASLVRELGISDHVTHVGKPDAAGLGRLLAGAHALVVPSRWDSLPLVCLEAAFARVPVVGAAVGGIPEALHHGEHALHFVPEDVEGCAAALAATLTDRAAAESRAARAFARAERSFRLSSYLEATDAFLADALTAFESREEGRAGVAQPALVAPSAP